MINPDELLFIVDENNKPLAPVIRKIAHKKVLWHRTTGIWVINKKRQVLCQKRSLLKDQNPGKWEAFFGGHLGPDEDYLESAVREVSEELGKKITKDQLVVYQPVVKGDKKTHREFQYVFALFLDEDSNSFQFEKEEIDQLKWIDLDEVKKILLEIKDENWVQKPWDEEVIDWITILTK